MAQAEAVIERRGLATLDASSVVSNHSGPACLFDAARRPLIANAMWHAAGLPGPRHAESKEKSYLPGQLAVDLQTVSTNQIPLSSMLRMDVQSLIEGPEDANNEVTYEFNILPMHYDGEPALLALGTDQTAIVTLQHALQDSREFHRAFASCSADFIWQVDAGGIIDYTGPRGLLDYSPDELFGSPIARLFTDTSEAEASLVFQSREPIWESEVWLSDRKGESHCFLVSSIPVLSSFGQWHGTRGVGREVTEQREREAELKKAKISQRMINSVLHAMRSEVDPLAILKAATIVAADSAGLDGCLVARRDRADNVEWIATSLPAPQMKFAYSGFSSALLSQMSESIDQNTPGLIRFATPADTFLIAVTHFENQANGAIAFGRTSGVDGADDALFWSPEDKHILRAMTEQLGVSLAQFELVETLRQGRQS